MTQFKGMILGMTAFLCGIAAGSLFSFYIVVVCLIFILLAGFILYFKTSSQVFRFFLIIFLGFCFGVVRFCFSVPVFTTEDVAYYRDMKEPVQVEGIINNEVDLRSDNQHFIFEAQKIFYQNRYFDVKGKILVKAERYPEFSYGDLVRINGFLLAPPEFEKFSYADFLAKDHIYAVFWSPRITLLKENQGNFFWNFVFWLKDELNSHINQLFTEPEGSLVAGILMGLRRNIPSQVLDDFNRAGLTHVLAVSGYNITLMITVFGGILKKNSRKVRFFGILGGIFLFLLFTGFSASVIRAAWMAFFVIVARFSGRKSNGLLILLLSACMMVFLSPAILLSDLSFELSFAATLGIILIMPLWKKYFDKLPAWLGEGLSVTLAAQVFTTPIIVYYFGRISLIAPFANILFLPLIPLIMLFSFVALMLSFVFLPLATFFASIGWLFLKILLMGVHVVAHVPFASVGV